MVLFLMLQLLIQVNCIFLMLNNCFVFFIIIKTFECLKIV